MSRPDGRIEPGQPLRGAISARAWNRAQDAADLVLGARTGITAISGTPDVARLVASVRVPVPQLYPNGFPPGMAVRITGAQATPTSTSVPPTYDGSVKLEYLTGQLSQLTPYASRFSGALAIALDGTSEAAGASVVLSAVISGLAVVRVRRFDATHSFAINPIQRVSEAGVQQHCGILDSHPCSCDSSVRVVAYLGNATTFTDATNATIVWAVVVV
jgi:hypothetical protein